ncbi:hypothetical protein FQN57_003171 [Myotisia sp. PD_48]|nr:hypothetical protein FQN57_003171 [Myotisia sp. PD_48]
MSSWRRRPSSPIPSLLFLLRIRAVKVLLWGAILWLLAFQYCRFRFWRDPHSAFFDDRHVYDLKYSSSRESEAQRFLSLYNSSSDSPNPVRAGNNPTICIAFVTVKRNSADYLGPSIGSLLEGLDPRERQAIHLNIVFADTDPAQHPSWKQKWVERLADTASAYDIPDAQFKNIQEVEKSRNFYVKGVFDYVYALNTCQAINAPYTLIFEDDIILAEGWMVKTLKALVDLGDASKYNKPWIYLRLFYTETSLSWTTDDFAYRNMPHIFGFVMFCAFMCLMGFRRLRSRSFHQDSCTVAVICLICVPGFLALVYMAGKLSVIPFRGVVEMNSYGCCTQGLLFPQQQVDGLIQYLRGRGHGQTDSMIEEYATETNLMRYALTPQQLQHVGMQSSRDNTEINTRSTWAFWFEANDAAVLRKEHEQLLHDKGVETILNKYG